MLRIRLRSNRATPTQGGGALNSALITGKEKAPVQFSMHLQSTPRLSP